MSGTREARPRGGADRAQEMSCVEADNFKNNPPPSKSQGQNRKANLNGGRASREKGNRLERSIVKLFQEHGFGAERVPLSGSAGGSYFGDLTVPVIGRDLVVEAKARDNGFRTLYDWLIGRDALIIKADRRDALVVLPLRLAVEIAVAAERGKGRAP
jgi:hypothetical protein